MTISTYEPGDLVRVAVVFAVATVATDPSTIVCQVRDPAGNLTTPTVVHDSTGAYHANVDLTGAVAGLWAYRWSGTGACQAAEEASFYVAKSAVL